MDTVQDSVNLLTRPHDCTDLGNAARFVLEHHEDLWYVATQDQWYIWDGQRFCPDRKRTIYELAKSTVDKLFDEARQCTDSATAKLVSNWAVSSRHKARLQAMVSLAHSDENIAAVATDFDRRSCLINTLSGVVDLRTGELIGHNKGLMCTKLTSILYNPTAGCPTWDGVLKDLFLDDRDLIRWMQRAVGYSLTGETKEQCFFLAYGTGSNGKSTFFETLLQLLGEYGRASDFEAFTQRDQNVRAMEAIARLKGVRLAIASETQDSKRLNEAVVKRITGGDTVTASFLHKGAFQFRPEFKLWLAVNHLPGSRDGSHGFWRRVRVVPFRRKFEGSGVDKDLGRRLEQELPGILAWAIKGAMAWYKHGLGTCSAIEEATADYRQDQDVFSRFLEEATERNPASQVQAGDFHKAFLSWCDDNQEEAVGRNVFASRLAERDIAKTRTKVGTFYKGIQVSPGGVHDHNDF